MSDSEQQKRITIRANAKSNSLTSIAIGSGLLALSLVWFAIAPAYFNLPGFFLVSAGLIGLLIGWFKMREPDFSFVITPDTITYRHRLGQWHIPWHDVQRFDQPRVRHGLEHKALELIGIRITDYQHFVEAISPRLATHLLMEQRPLLLQNSDESCTTGMCAGSELLDGTHFKLPNGEALTGVQAMLANRMKALRERLGYDVFVSATELDRQPAEFIALLKSCQQSR